MAGLASHGGRSAGQHQRREWHLPLTLNPGHQLGAGQNRIGASAPTSLRSAPLSIPDMLDRRRYRRQRCPIHDRLAAFTQFRLRWARSGRTVPFPEKR
jgi:hypothetical protein